MGKLIVIEGLDGSGKGTQAKILAETLEKQGEKVKKVSFPVYESNSSALVKMYLAGEFGTRPGDVNAYAASSFYAVDRFASFKSDWEKLYSDDYIIIADRYTTSNGVHQCSKLPEEQWEDYMDWLYDFEYVKMGIPKPDCVIYLDMSPEVSQKLLSGRYRGDESKKDIHEKDREYLARSRKAARFCAEHDKWTTIKCDNGQNPYTIEEIALKVLNTVSPLL
ncbi:MAG: deoxynucleoside kinase [Oscillospiraceae bacterium]|nr:deoxynucleoside kinase [Oscillospiraceae bacterium]